MADKIKFLYGSTADIDQANSNNSSYPQVTRGQVYFAIDSLDANAANGKIYFDVPIGTGTLAKRIPMNDKVQMASSAVLASSAIKTQGSLNFSNGQNFDGSSGIEVGDTIHYLPGTSTTTSITNHSQATATGSGIYSTRWGAIVDNSITFLYSGLTIAYKVPIAGNGSYGNVLRLTKPDGTPITNPNNTSANNGYYPVIKEATTWITTHYSAGSIILLVFDADQVTTNLRPVNSSTMSITGCWKTVDYDTTNVYQLRHANGNYTASTAIYRYALLAESSDTTLTPFFNPTSNENWTNTNKVAVAIGFRPQGQFLYRSGTGVINTNGGIGATELWEQYPIDLRYSFNISTSTFTSHKNVYLVTSLPSGTEGLVTVDSTTPLVQDLPTTNTNKLYILLGRAYNGYCIELYLTHPIYVFLNNRLRIYGDYADSAKNADIATNDAREQNIADTYIKGINVSGTTLTYTYGNNIESTPLTLQDNDYRLKVTSTSSNSQKIYLFGSTATDLGTNNKTVTGTGMSHTNIYISTSGIIHGTITNASTAAYADTALKDSEGQQINTTYIKNISISGTTLTYTRGTTDTPLTLPDNDYRLKVTSTSSNGSKIYLFGSTSTTLGTNNKTVTGTGMSRTDIYIGTDGIINGTIKNASTAAYANTALKDNQGQQIDSTYMASFISTAINGTVPTLIFSNGAGSEYSNKIQYTPLGNDGKIALKYLPSAALERVHVVSSTAAMVALTTATVQNGDVVKIYDSNNASNDPGKMYYVKDDTKLNQLAGYEEFAVGTAGAVAWSNIQGAPLADILSTNSTASLATSISTATITVEWSNLNNSTRTDILTIPAASTDVAGLVTCSTSTIQTFGGPKTFNSTVKVSGRLNYSGIQTGSGATNYIWFSSSASKGIPTYSTALYYDVTSNLLHATTEKAVYDDADDSVPIKSKYVVYSKTIFSTATNELTVGNAGNSEKTFEIQNYYPSTASWTAASQSVTLTIENRSHKNAAMVNSVVTETIPLATASSAGIVSASAQTFGGVKTFKDGIIATGVFKANNAGDSTYSQDSNASIYTNGGISVSKQLSAKQIRIDDNASTEGVVLQYHGGLDTLSFVFV